MMTDETPSSEPSALRASDEAYARLPGVDTIRAHAAWLLPTLVAVVGIVPSVWALREQSFAIFGRDQGIFQYVAWALRHGERAYRDIHEINGPLPHAWHILMQSIGGEDEHVFRSIDTVMLGAAYTFAAATLPRWVGLDIGQGKRKHAALVAWALAGLTLFGAQYTRYDWWHTAQREALYSILVLTSLALQSLAHSTQSRTRALALFGFAGVLSSLTWFGKPPCAIFSVLQGAVLVVDRKNLAVSLRRATLAAMTGATVVGLAMLAFVLEYADIARGIEILSKVPQLHHTIWNETLLGAYRSYNNAPRLDWAMATLAAFVATFFVLRLPRRTLLAGVLPVGGFIVFAGQGKAFPYHLHMLTLGTTVTQLVVLGAIAHWLQRPHASVGGSRTWRHDALALGVAFAAVALGLKAAEDAWKSPGMRGRWAAVGGTAEQRASRAYFDHFPWGDYFANDLRDAAAYLAFHTLPDERVQTYGFDPYLLFLARRKSASPVIYSFELNVDAALKGGPGARPSPELRQWLLAYRDEAEKLVLRSVDASPPAAFVLLDRAPFTHPEDAERDLAEHCPDLFRWMKQRYDFAVSFGAVRIWLRNDVLARDALR
ncbi:MAG TPA: hypothetical protein VM580_07160 [Labilithrix sp.]|nr:hypothetical protein [Labilithrix sp.]